MTQQPMPLRLPIGLPAPDPVSVLRDQAEAAAACHVGPLPDVPVVLAEQLHAWIWSEEQDNLTHDQRRELDRIPTLLHAMADAMRGRQ